MAIKRLTICDRCGQEIGKAVFPRINLRGDLELWSCDREWPIRDLNIILCPACTRDMLRFMKMQEAPDETAD